jgi:hypothetical protein
VVEGLEKDDFEAAGGHIDPKKSRLWLVAELFDSL